MKKYLCTPILFGFWLLLMDSIDVWVILTGLAVSLLVTAGFGSLYNLVPSKMFNPVRWLLFLVYVPYFLYYCVKANIDVALRVIHPDVPISPGIVKVRTVLTSPMAKTFLANSITLTPGTLTMDIDGQDLYVHCITVGQDNEAQRSARICGRFEPLLRRIFE